MNDAEKIEALREWVRSNDEPDFGQFAAGYLKALTEVRDIIDPPKPRWRELVGQAAKVVTDNPLEGVLKHLSVIAYNPSPEGLEWGLARIVALCEQEVGDGWQADPDEWPGDVELDVESLIDALAEVGNDRWLALGDRAACWLRSLTDGGVA